MYFTHLASSNAPNNSLQRLALGLLKTKSNLLVNNADAFIDELRKQIDTLNAENPRCKALRLSTYDGTNSIGVYLGGAYTVGFYLYPVKNGGQQS